MSVADAERLKTFHGSVLPGQADEREDPAGLRGQTQGFGTLEADRSVLAFDPHGFEADLGDEGHEEGGGTVDRYGTDASGGACRVEEDVVSGVDGSILR